MRLRPTLSRVRWLTGADVIFDPVGGALFDEAMKAAAPWGAQYLIIGFAAGGIPKVRRCRLFVGFREEADPQGAYAAGAHRNPGYLTSFVTPWTCC